MSFDVHSLEAYSTIASVSGTNPNLSIVVQTGDGAKFGNPQNVTIWPAGAQPTQANSTIGRISGIASNTLTVTTAQEGSSNITVSAGMQIANTITPKVLTDIEGNFPAGAIAAWTTYTPTLAGGSPNIGSTGTISGRYLQVGKMVTFQVQIVVGGTGISAGSGAYTVTLPVTAQSAFITANGNPFVGNTNLFQSSGSLNFLGATQINASTTAQVVLFTLTTLTSGAIFALGIWGSATAGIATGNIATISGTYEAA